MGRGEEEREERSKQKRKMQTERLRGPNQDEAGREGEKDSGGAEIELGLKTEGKWSGGRETEK